MNEPETIRVMVVDDHRIVREGLASYLSTLPNVVLVGEAADGVAALAMIAKLDVLGEPPHVVLTDVKMPNLDGEGLISACRERYPRIQVVVVTGFQEAPRIRTLLAAGAAGYVLKDASVERIADAITSAHSGAVHLDPIVARILTQALVQQQGATASLSEREQEVLVLVAGGASNQGIADRLHLSERTARTHVSNIIMKLGVQSRTQAALEAIRGGLVTIE